jgi:hypothetical protein
MNTIITTTPLDQRVGAKVQLENLYLGLARKL